MPPYFNIRNYAFNEEWWTFKRYKAKRVNEILHSETEPAITFYNSDGKKFREEWYINGVVHRDGGYAVTTYYGNGEIQSRQWFTNGILHREDDNGKSLPAVINFDCIGCLYNIEYYKFNKLHREYGPAKITHKYQSKSICYKEWYVDGLRHNLEGPAHVDLQDNVNTYYIMGKKVKKQQFYKLAFIYRTMINIAIKIKRRRVTSKLSIDTSLANNGRDICNLISEYVY